MKTPTIDHANNKESFENGKTEVGARWDFYNFFFERLGNEESYIKLYKYGEDNKREWLHTYYNEIPDETQVATKFGGGHYRAYGYKTGQNEKNACTKDFWISEIWTRRKEEREKKELSLNGHQPVNQNNVLLDSLTILEKLVNIVKPLTQNQNQSKQNPFEMMEGFTNMFTKTMGNMFNQTAKAEMDRIQQYREQSQSIIDNKEQEKEDDQSWLKDILNIIKMFSSQFEGAKGSKLKAMQDFIKNSDQYKDVISDTEKLTTIYEVLCSDPGYGKDKADALLSKLGLEISESE